MRVSLTDGERDQRHSATGRFAPHGAYCLSCLIRQGHNQWEPSRSVGQSTCLLPRVASDRTMTRMLRTTTGSLPAMTKPDALTPLCPTLSGLPSHRVFS